MRKNEILDILRLDQILINESFRRLVDGTCYLRSEDRDQIWDLFDKSAQAVREHIAIEEEGLLNKIPTEEASIMRNEHKKLEEFLGEARYALEKERPISFKALIAALKTSMIEHERIESHLFRSIDFTDFDHDAMTSLKRRISEKVV